MPYEWFPGAMYWLSGLEPYAVMQALLSERPRWGRTGRTYGALVRTVWCRTATGQGIIAVLRPRGTNSFDWWLVGARPMTADEEIEFTQWEADHA